MEARRRFGLGLVVLAGSVWGLVAAECGLWLLFGMPRSGLTPGAAGIAGGVAFLAMAQFIFTGLVADRVFPDFGRTYGWWVEVGSALLFLVSMLVTGAFLILGGSTA